MVGRRRRDEPHAAAQRAAAPPPGRRRRRRAHRRRAAPRPRACACDLHEFQRLAIDALAAARADPELAGGSPSQAVAIGDGAAVRRLRVRRVGGRGPAGRRAAADHPARPALRAGRGRRRPARAQALAERALRLDRYTDSRYVRLAELLTLQNRVAAAMAVLDDAAEVARDMGEGPPGATKAVATNCSVGRRRGSSSAAVRPASEDREAPGHRGRAVWTTTASPPNGATRRTMDMMRYRACLHGRMMRRPRPTRVPRRPTDAISRRCYCPRVDASHDADLRRSTVGHADVD